MDNKKNKEKVNDFYELIHTATHPIRIHILFRLEFEKLYASKLEEMLKHNRKIISFHLSKLERAGLVTSEYGLMTSKTRPMAVRYYTLTTDGAKLVTKLKLILSD
ncbi:MAG TPA: ArsR family transcriptional regulator [Nitrososphaeraceae archaeon]|jgi:predicted transcriptional regulator